MEKPIININIDRLVDKVEVKNNEPSIVNDITNVLSDIVVRAACFDCDNNDDIDEIVIKRKFLKTSKSAYVSKIEQVTITIQSKEYSGSSVFSQYSDYEKSTIKKAIDILLGKHEADTSGDVRSNRCP
ncbi:hypothetical protein [Elizabethkingia meningoseptica]|uniref:hypothetical protein n=1 Tax=Elizabethkingia meningoseptica TaxID=238 RepID=UPI0023AECDA5|nr:hypothetical protein [Elizabethkingia meningoseptica]MDE5525664.1 hypothetical protein [Elizabethkingia meningoseptica]